MKDLTGPEPRSRDVTGRNEETSGNVEQNINMFPVWRPFSFKQRHAESQPLSAFLSFIETCGGGVNSLSVFGHT